MVFVNQKKNWRHHAWSPSGIRDQDPNSDEIRLHPALPIFLFHLVLSSYLMAEAESVFSISILFQKVAVSKTVYLH